MSATSGAESPRRELHAETIRLAGPVEEFSFEFVQRMANRMAVSYHRYGPLASAYPHKTKALASLRERLDLYELEANIEWYNRTRVRDAARLQTSRKLTPKKENSDERARKPW
ncbi:MAG TPA: hypothetical protein DCQ04_14975 [Actinobacteria bacterium]|nr:hypothetical protein [Acidimicrobiia bacterium]HAM23533.1 hypothetical protein [Actinomycetota bacterium]